MPGGLLYEWCQIIIVNKRPLTLDTRDDSRWYMSCFHGFHSQSNSSKGIWPYIIIDPPTFTESGRFAILLAGNPCDNPAFHFHLKEDSE
jgi:hypothetical protein